LRSGSRRPTHAGQATELLVRIVGDVLARSRQEGYFSMSF
jgi:hypothetical protein